MADENYSDQPYVDTDLQYAKLIGNLLDPPKGIAAAEVQSPTRQTNYAQDMARTSSPSAPATTTSQASGPQPQTYPVPRPSPAAPSPGVVTQSGNPSNQMTWPDYVRRNADAAQAAMERSQSAVTGLQDQASAQQRNAPVEQRVQQLSTPTPYRDPKTGQVLDSAQQYKPTGWQRFGRGVKSAVIGLATGGIPGAVVGAIEPDAVRGGTAYGAPNRAYQTTEANRQAQLGAANQQLSENLAEDKADSERLGKLASENRSEATGYLDIGKTVTAEQTEEERERNNQQVNDLKQQVADARAQGKMPTTYEATVVAGALEPDPGKKAAYQAAAKQMADTEVRKFQYKAAQDGEPRNQFRQSLIDNATQQVQALQDSYTYNPHRNSYVDEKGNELTPAQFTDKKNQIATKLDAQLGAKKLKPLGVRFNPADAGANKPTGRAASQPTAAKVQVQPPASLLSKTPEGGAVVGQGGETFVKRGGQWAQQ